MRLASCLSASLLTLPACGGGGSSPNIPTPPAAVAPPAATPAPNPSAPPAGPTVLRTAPIEGANGHAASGTARILRDGDSFTLELGGDFRIDSGNNDVYLARDSATVTSGDLNLGDMKSITGLQTYAMPNDGGAYSFVVLWCRPFRIPIGFGRLR